MKDNDNAIGRQIGSYLIRSEIGSGSYGRVYLGKHIIFDNDNIVAIKLLHTFMGSDKERAQFLQEAQFLHRLQHPHILPVLDAGLQDGTPYIIMEYAVQGSLQDRLDRQPGKALPLAESIAIITDIGEALHYAHQQNIVHRDVKPENILFNASGEALLADFGIALALTSARTGARERSGTPAYMAPEQFEGKVSIKSDQYALGCIAFEMVTGKKPFEVENVGIEAVWYQHAKVEPTPPTKLNPQLPLHVEQAILKAMTKDRGNRYSDILNFIGALQNATKQAQEEVNANPKDENSKENSADNLQSADGASNKANLSESPNNNPMSDRDEIIFGIDLGTTYSCISYVDEYGKAVVIPNKENNLTTPSVVLFEGENRVVGDEAKKLAKLDPDSVVEMVKRHMGEANWRYNYNGRDVTAEEISSYILRKLAVDTEEALNIPVKEVVITCPAYFGIPQREATALAGEIAGFNVREVINEPTAAAITYGLQKEQDQVVLVYDLGGGTFDVTVIEIKGGSITVIATGGDSNLGGRNWDEAIIGYLSEQWRLQTGSSEEPTDTLETLQDLWERAEQAKFSLTQRLETNVVVSHEGKVAKVTLTRDKFNELTTNLLSRTTMFMRFTMDDAKARGFDHIDQILLVGGSTKMPQVKEELEREFNIPLKVFEPDAAVAKGAALYGQKLLIDKKIQSAIRFMMGTSVDYVDMADAAPKIITNAEEQVANDLNLQLNTVQHYHKAEVTNVANIPNNPTVGASYSSNIFFINHHEADRSWAEWVAWQLEEEGYTVILPAWNFPPGSTIRIEMQKATTKATCIIILLSSNYLNYRRSQGVLSLSKTFEQTIMGGQRDLIPVRVGECDLQRTKLRTIKCIDLVGLDEPKARKTLLAGIRKESGKPEKRPNFPAHHILNEQPDFPFAQNELNGTSASQLVSQVKVAFANKDWPDVIRKTRFLIKQMPHSVTCEICHMQGLALLEEGETELACESLDTALSLTSDTKMRLSLLKVYTEALASLKQWNKVLALTNEALRLIPADPYWLASRQDTLAKVSMSVEPKQKSIEIFFSYSRRDIKMRKKLEEYLSNLQRQFPLNSWHDGVIEPGTRWQEEIIMHLNSADIILLLISQTFIASNFCFDVEMAKALERDKAGKAHVVPIILSPSTWKTTPLKDLQALPTDGKAITEWRNKDRAFLDIAKGIQRIIDNLKDRS